MFRLKSLQGPLGLCVALVLLLIVNASVSADPTPGLGGQTAVPEITTPATTDCQQALEGAPFEALEGGSCKAEPKSGLFPELIPVRGGRTCRCSCGFPCKTDADCGGGVGSCRGGISCC